MFRNYLDKLPCQFSTGTETYNLKKNRIFDIFLESEVEKLDEKYLKKYRKP